MNYYQIILVLLTIGGTFVTIWGIYGWLKSRQRLQWPVTNGLIEGAAAAMEQDDLLPEIDFRYEVAGQTYHCPLSLPSGTQPSPELSKTLLERYPLGKQVTVRYNPENPGLGELSDPHPRGDWLIIALGIASAGMGLMALFSRIH